MSSPGNSRRRTGATGTPFAFRKPTSDELMKHLLPKAESPSCTTEDLIHLRGCFLSTDLSASLAIRAAAVFCQHLNSPEFEVTKELPASLKRNRELAFVSLSTFAETMDESLQMNGRCIPTRDIQPITRQSWKNVWKWMQYFMFEFESGSSPSGYPWTRNQNEATAILTGILVSDFIGPKLLESAFQNDGLFPFIVKLWKMSDNFDAETGLQFHVRNRILTLYGHGFQSIAGRTSESRDAARSVILKAMGASENADSLARRFMRYLKPPATRANYALVALVLPTIVGLVIQNHTSNMLIPSELMKHFVEHGLVPCLSRYLYLASSKTPKDSRMENMRPTIIANSIPLLTSASLSNSSPRSAVNLLKHQFLRSVMNVVVASPPLLPMNNMYRGLLQEVFTGSIALFLCYRDVLQQAIKEVKEILADDLLLKRLESTFLKPIWDAFVQLVLERTIFNAIYERDCTEETRIENIRRCCGCHRFEDEVGTKFSLCSGCQTHEYCSTMCQRNAWKDGHKTSCKSLAKIWNDDGVKLSKPNLFLKMLAFQDIRRHASGLREFLRQDAVLNNLQNPQELVIRVLYDKKSTPQMELTSMREMEKWCGGGTELNKEGWRNMQRDLRDDHMWMVLHYFRGAKKITTETCQISFDCLAQPLEPPSEIRTWARAPARVYSRPDSKPLAFGIDQIDMCLSDVHHNFGPQARERASKNSSSETVLDYVERKIASGELIPDPVFR